ncbi:hypothetical protein BMS3Abin14_00136 [bacterium BMS3Abin14]|nr:hypothetical protein BMS3Abin14_00136 [bacterium BMS3Abin14]
MSRNFCASMYQNACAAKMQREECGKGIEGAGLPAIGSGGGYEELPQRTLV